MERPNFHTYVSQSYLFTFIRRRLIIILLVLGVIIVIAAPLIYYFRVSSSASSRQTNPGDKIVAKVGQENIYQADLDHYAVALPGLNPADKKNYFLPTLVSQSIILQGGAADGLIKLDSSVFNSPTKDYAKREQLVNETRQKVTAESEGPKGTVVAIWFDLQASPSAKLSYSQRQKTALEKIAASHQAVLNKTMTIDQAADNIRKDSSMAALDPHYKINASFTFAPAPAQAITTYPEFDKILDNLKANQVSDIFPAPKIVNSKETSSIAGYMFGEVTNFVDSSKVISFDDWFAQKKAIYKETTP